MSKLTKDFDNLNVMERLNSLHKQVPPDYYEEGIKRNKIQAYWHKKRFVIIKELLKESKAKNILDIGCHSGMLTNLIHDWTNASVTGIDISEKSVQYAKVKYPRVNFIAKDVQSGLPFSDKTFELITCFDILEHLPKLDQVLAEIRRVLKNRGEIIISVPNENLLFRLVWFLWTRGRGRVWDDVHVYNFTDSSIDDVVVKHGFARITKIKLHLGMYQIIKYKKNEQQ